VLSASVANYLLEEIVTLIEIARENKLEHLAYLLGIYAAQSERIPHEKKEASAWAR
jgi:hypothetical protein